MQGEGIAAKAQLGTLCLLAFLIPFPFIYGTLAIWALIAAWLCGLNFRARAGMLAKQPALWPWLALFALYACSYFWSADKDQSVFDSVSKLSFVIMPVCIGTGAALSPVWIRRVTESLALGCSTVAVICLYNAWTRYHAGGTSNVFFYHELVRGFDANAVYMGWYAIVAVSGLLLIRNREHIPWGIRLLRTIGVLLLIVFLILLSSRLLLVIFVMLTVPLYALSLLNSTARRWQTAVIILAITGALAGSIALTGNPVSKRFRDVMHRDVQIAYLDNYRDTIPHFNNVTLRLFAWRVGMENIREHRLWLKGAGNGDEHQLQNERFEKLGLTLERQKEYNIPLQNMNLHNMFMQSFLGLGIPGLLLFSLIVFLPFTALRRAPNNNFFLLFHCCSILFMLQESALQTQAGIVFYSFLSVIYWKAVKSKETAGRFVLKKGN
jgi:O-antigen ligase